MSYLTSKRRGERGSALVECALLLPVYMLVIVGLLHIGTLSLVRVDTSRAAIFLSSTPGLQTVADLPTRVLRANSGKIYTQGVSDITRLEDTESDVNIYSGQDVFENLEEMARAPTGRYQYQNGTIVYVLDPDNLSPFGRYIFDNRLQDHSDEIATLLNGWMKRSEATVEYSHLLPIGGLDLTQVVDTQHDLIPVHPDRGSHQVDGFGSDFNSAVPQQLFGQDLPDPERGLDAFWIPN